MFGLSWQYQAKAEPVSLSSEQPQLDKWAPELFDIRRTRKVLPAAILMGMVGGRLFAQIPFPPGIDSWEPRLSQPYFKRPNPVLRLGSFHLDPLPLPSPPVIDLDRWDPRLTQPVLQKRKPVRTGSFDIGPLQTPETIRLEKWEPRVTQPVLRKKRPTITGGTDFDPFPFASPPATEFDKWETRLSQPYFRKFQYVLPGQQLIDPYPIPPPPFTAGMLRVTIDPIPLRVIVEKL